MANVVTVIFTVESEAYQAFSELRKAPKGEGYVTIEAALLKRKGDSIIPIDGFDSGIYTTDDTATGMIVGSVVGILAGPLGVLLGASTGALVGSALDESDAIDSNSLIEVTANKIFDGEIAIVALVDEEEPAFDAPFEKYRTGIIRYDEETVSDDVDRAIETYDEMQNLAKQQMRAERKAKRSTRRDSLREGFKARFQAFVKKNDKALDEARAKFIEHEDKVDAKLDKIDGKLSARADKVLGKENALDEAFDSATKKLDSATEDLLGL